MKKIVCLFLLVILLTLSACSQEILPLDNPEIEDFNILYVHVDENQQSFAIYKRDINPEEDVRLWTLEGYPINDGYMLGSYHKSDYRVHYDGNYYYLQQGYFLGLYTAEDLIRYGVTGISRSCSAVDSCD